MQMDHWDIKSEIWGRGAGHDKLPLKITEEDEEKDKATVSQAAAKDLSTDAAAATVLSEQEGIFILNENKEGKDVFSLLIYVSP